MLVYIYQRGYFRFAHWSPRASWWRSWRLNQPQSIHSAPCVSGIVATRLLKWPVERIDMLHRSLYNDYMYSSLIYIVIYSLWIQYTLFINLLLLLLVLLLYIYIYILFYTYIYTYVSYVYVHSQPCPSPRYDPPTQLAVVWQLQIRGVPELAVLVVAVGVVVVVLILEVVLPPTIATRGFITIRFLYSSPYVRGCGLWLLWKGNSVIVLALFHLIGCLGGR